MIRFFGLIIQFTVAAAAIVGALFDLTNKQTSSESQSQPVTTHLMANLINILRS